MRMLKHMLIAIVAAFAFAQAASAETPSTPAPPAPAAVATPAPTPPVAPVAPAAVQPAAPVQRREEAERPSIADRVKGFMTANAGTAQLAAQIATLTRERDEARQQLGTITAERDDFRRQLTDVEAALSGQQAIVKATATEIASTVGIPLASLPAPIAGNGGSHYDSWLEAKGSAKSAIYREHKAAIRAEAARRGAAL